MKLQRTGLPTKNLVRRWLNSQNIVAEDVLNVLDVKELGSSVGGALYEDSVIKVSSGWLILTVRLPVTCQHQRFSVLVLGVIWNLPSE
jgi:hypothetical protein